NRQRPRAGPAPAENGRTSVGCRCPRQAADPAGRKLAGTPGPAGTMTVEETCSRRDARMSAALGALAHHLRRRAAPPHAPGPSAADLLGRWRAGRDAAASEALLRRHGPMVLALCRRLLRDEHAAEDAFQAAFLILARKAGAIGRGEALASWLYRVAYRTA